MNLSPKIFNQESFNTKEFIEFAADFKKEIGNELINVGAKLIRFNLGHFYLSGFFILNNKLFYFSWHNGNSMLLYRTAKNENDFYGGQNQYIHIGPGMFQNIR